MAEDFQLTLTTDKSPEQLFELVINPRNWWNGYHAEEIVGDTEKLNDAFSFRAAGGIHYTEQKIIELIPNQKIVWLITNSALTYLDNAEEWMGTKVIFEIIQEGNKTQLIFTHEGLVPAIECYESCSFSWTQYLQNKLLPLL